MADKTPALGNGERHRDRGWRKSSHSLTNGHCLEAACLASGQVGIRDSQVAGGPVLAIQPRAWTAFVGGLRIS